MIPRWFNPTINDIALIKRLLGSKVVEPFCGNGYLLSLLGGDITGIDEDTDFKDMQGLNIVNATIEQFLDTDSGRATWNQADTVISCYPPCEYLLKDPSLIAAENVMDHQRLILITPRPYDNMMISGTPGMWEYVFSRMSMIEMHKVGFPNSREMLYVLQTRNENKEMTSTKDAILGDHSLWDMGENYIFGKEKIHESRPR